MSIRDRLKDEISYHGLLLKELANKAEISKRTLDSYVDSREIMPAADVAVRIATVLNVSVEYLVTGKNKSKNGEMDKYKPLRKMLDELLILPEDVLNTVKVMIHESAQAELEKQKKETAIGENEPS